MGQLRTYIASVNDSFLLPIECKGVPVRPIIYSAANVVEAQHSMIYVLHTFYDAQWFKINSILAIPLFNGPCLTSRVVGLLNQTERSSNGLKCPTWTTNGPRFQIVLSTPCWRDTRKWELRDGVIGRIIYGVQRIFPAAVSLSKSVSSTLTDYVVCTYLYRTNSRSIHFNRVVLSYPWISQVWSSHGKWQMPLHSSSLARHTTE